MHISRTTTEFCQKSTLFVTHPIRRCLKESLIESPEELQSDDSMFYDGQVRNQSVVEMVVFVQTSLICLIA
jgi:hypothetical protein